eukprot:5432799-Alexandrium_andersonii.AAC.1
MRDMCSSCPKFIGRNSHALAGPSGQSKLAFSAPFGGRGRFSSSPPASARKVAQNAVLGSSGDDHL